MRIISGTLKGRRLETPDWPGLRPTSDRLRETLFNVLAPRIQGARFLDAYAGTGAVGIEALSRGAAHVTFVEHDRRAQRLIEDNLARCGASDRHAIIRAGFAAAAASLSEPFQLLFLDPPYGAADFSQSLEAAAPLMTDDAVMIIEHARRDRAPEHVAGLTRTRELLSGDSALSFFAKHE
ncbi:MAG: 16S rRNA (guanine(966)-N(2))-methyltransferase RsmD [Acidobacteria bacterium]|nr:16S rRNA (guanine(966)-N(2))-methyltransferase RsmD [Acidobacteriota bacterium]